jgi:hypothetical protein
MNWVRVTRRSPCPVCQHPDWCSVSEDGTTVVCMRVESPKPCKSGGWFHDLKDKPVKDLPKPRPKPAPVPQQNFTDLACRYVEDLHNIDIVAQELGVSVRSLERLQIGWAGHGLSFPMRNGSERIVGIRIRGKGRKWCVPGSRHGLFWPEGVYANSPQRLIVAEGPTDCAALLDLGFDAIGRPSCLGGVDLVTEFLRGRRREVVIMADKDPPKKRPDGSVWFPGQEGAEALAKAIRPLCRTLKIVKPPFNKDIRDWYRSGATHDVIESIIRNVRFYHDVPNQKLG